MNYHKPVSLCPWTSGTCENDVSVSFVYRYEIDTKHEAYAIGLVDVGTSTGVFQNKM
jgi:hypothetical protein